MDNMNNINEQNNFNYGNMPHPQNMNYTVKRKEKRTVSAGAADLVAAFVSFAAIYFMIYNSFFGIYFTIGYTLLFLCASVYMVVRGGKINACAVVTGVFCIISSASLSFYDDFVLNVAVIIMLMYLSCEYCLIVCGGAKYSSKSYFRLLDIFRCEIVIPLKNLLLPYRSMVKSKGKKMSGILVGLLCAVPVLAVVIPLLVKSDAIFENIVKNITHSVGEYLLVAVGSIIVTFFIFSTMFAFASSTAKEDNLKYNDSAITKMRAVGKNGFIGFLSVICLVYVVYLVSQFSYLFSAFSGHLPNGEIISLSEYARRGFFEMSAVAAINFLLIAIGVLFSKRENGKINGVIKGFDLFLGFFTLILIATAMAKMVMYIDELGLTRKRVFVSAFIVVLFVWFVAVIIRLFKNGFPYFRAMVATACIMITLLSFADVNTVIAKYNTNAYLTGKIDTVDVETLGDLDCYACIKNLFELTNDSNKNVSYSASSKLADMIFYQESENKTNIFKSGNLDSVRYYNFIFEHKQEIKEKYSEVADKYIIVFNINTEIGIQSISVDCGKKSYGVSNANNQDMKNGEEYAFYIDSEFETAQVCVVDSQGREYKEKLDLNNFVVGYPIDVLIYDSDDGNCKLDASKRDPNAELF